MLVLGRNFQDKILIGDNVIMTIVEITGKKVRIGFESPDGVKYIRWELLSREQQEKARAAARSS